MKQEVRKKFVFLLENFISFGCCKFELLRREYLSSVVIVLTNCLKILDITNRDIYQLYFFQSNEKIW